MEAAVVASLLPAPSVHALLNELPDACRMLMRARRAQQEALWDAHGGEDRRQCTGEGRNNGNEEGALESLAMRHESGVAGSGEGGRFQNGKEAAWGYRTEDSTSVDEDLELVGLIGEENESASLQDLESPCVSNAGSESSNGNQYEIENRNKTKHGNGSENGNESENESETNYRESYGGGSETDREALSIDGETATSSIAGRTVSRESQGSSVQDMESAYLESNLSPLSMGYSCELSPSYQKIDHDGALLTQAFTDAVNFVAHSLIENHLDRTVHGELVALIPELLTDQHVVQNVDLGFEVLVGLLGIGVERGCAPIWVAQHLFKAIRPLLGRVVEPGCDVDVPLGQCVCNYIRALSLEALREIDIRDVHRICHTMRNKQVISEVQLYASSVFVKAPILKRKLEGIDLIVDLKPTVDWIQDNEIVKALFDEQVVHSEVANAFTPIARRLARAGSLTHDHLGMLWGKSFGLLAHISSFLPNTEELDWIMDRLDGEIELLVRSEKRHHVGELVQTIGIREDVDIDLAFKCVAALWELENCRALIETIRAHVGRPHETELLAVVVQRSMLELEKCPRLFAQELLAGVWAHTPSLSAFMDELDIETKWTEALKHILLSNHTSFQEPNLSAAFLLGTEIVSNFGEQGRFLSIVWTIFEPYRGSDDSGRRDAFFRWIAKLCKSKVIYPDAALELFETHFEPMLQRLEQTSLIPGSDAYSQTSFLLLRELFLLINEEEVEDLRDSQNLSDTSGEDGDDGDDEGSLCYITPKGPIESLIGLKYLWNAAIHTKDNYVANLSIETLQSLYDPGLDPKHPDVMEARAQYIESCSQALASAAAINDSPSPIKRCLGLIEALLNEADTKGTRGYRPHGARQRGGIHRLCLTSKMDLAHQCSNESSEKEKPLELLMYGNATVWDLRCAVGSRTQHARWPAGRIALFWQTKSGARIQLSSDMNSHTLRDLGMKSDESLDFSHADEILLLERKPRVRLLDMAGNDLGALATAAFQAVFEEWANCSVMLGESDEPTLLMSQQDFFSLFMFCNTQTINAKAVERRTEEVFLQYGSVNDEEASQRYMTEEDFLHFYRDAVHRRPLTVWKDLFRHGFDNKLQREEMSISPGRVTSEFRMSSFTGGDLSEVSRTPFSDEDPESPTYHENDTDKVIGWRGILGQNAKLYKTLFDLLQKSSGTLKEQCWSMLMRLPTSESMLNEIQALDNKGKEVLGMFSKQAGEFLNLYALHIVLSLMEEDESKKIIQKVDANQSIPIEQHFRRARRASYEPAETLSACSASNDCVSDGKALAPQEQQRNASPNWWTERFLAVEGFDALLNLLDGSPPFNREVVELCLKACKLVVTYTKLDGGLLGPERTSCLELNDCLRLLALVRGVLESALSGASWVSMAAADYALYIANVCYSRLGSVKGADLDLLENVNIEAALSRTASDGQDLGNPHSKASEEEYSRQLWRDSFAQFVLKSSARFTRIRDDYIAQLTRLYLATEMEDWLTTLLSTLLDSDPLSQYLPSDNSDENDVLFDQSLVHGILSKLALGNMRGCGLFNTMLRKSKQLLGLVWKPGQGKPALSEITLQVAHNLVSQRCVYKRDMLILLHTVCKAHSSASRAVSQVLIPVLRTRAPSLTTKPLCQVETERVVSKVGLENLGNTCYANSILQLFAAAPPLQELIFSAQIQSSEQRNVTEKKGKDRSLTVQQIQETLAFLLLSERRVYSPKQLVVDCLEADPLEQQDCEEFLNQILDVLEDTVPRTAWGNAFRGTTCATRICSSCNSKSTSVETTGSHLALDILNVESIREALHQNIFRTETLDGFKCGACGAIGTVSQSKELEKCPGVLILHLKRFAFDLKNGRKQKLRSTLRFEETLFEKELVSIVCHQGSAEQGHYYTYVRQLDRNVWFEMNDSLAREIDGFPTEAFDSAYILCYIDKQDPLVPNSAHVPRALQTQVHVNNVTIDVDATLRSSTFWELCLAVLEGVRKSALLELGEGASRRSSIGANPGALVPCWWPKAEERRLSTGITSKDSNLLERFASSIVRFLCGNGSVLETLHTDNHTTKLFPAIFAELAKSCRDDAGVLLGVFRSIKSVAKGPGLAPGSFYFIESLVSDIDDQDNRDMTTHVLLGDGSFLQAAINAFTTCGEEAKGHISRVIFQLLQFSSVRLPNNLAKSSQNSSPSTAARVLESILSQENAQMYRELLNSFLGTLFDDNGEHYVRAVVSLSRLSQYLAEIVLEVLVDQVDTDQASSITIPALRELLETKDEYAHARLATLLHVDQNGYSRPILSKLSTVLDVLYTELKSSASVEVFDSMHALIYTCTNHSTTTHVELHFEFLETEQSGHMRQAVLELEPGVTKLIHAAYKPDHEKGSISTTVEPFSWRAAPSIPSPCPSSFPGTVPSVFTDQENYNTQATASQLPAPPKVNTDYGLKGATFARQLETLKGMGFTNEEKVLRALEMAKGDENFAVECLLSDNLQM